MRSNKGVIKVLLGLTILLYASGTATSIGWIITTVNYIACQIWNIFWNIAAALAALIIVASGVRWIMSENDPGSRKGAKDAIVHAMVGLIIILVSRSLVALVTGVAPC